MVAYDLFSKVYPPHLPVPSEFPPTDTVIGLSGVGATANLAVAGFALTASGMYYWCDQRRREESRGIAAAVIGMKVLHEKKAREKAAEEAARAEAAAKAEEERKRNQRWYKFW